LPGCAGGWWATRLAQTAKLTEELAKARAVYQKLIQKHYEETGPVRRALEAESRKNPRTVSIRADLAIRREMRADVQRQIVLLKLRPGGMATGSDASMEEILKELRDLRREVRDLKRP